MTSMEAVRGQTPYSDRTLWHFLTQCLVHPTAPVLLTKDSPRHEISYASGLGENNYEISFEFIKAELFQLSIYWIEKNHIADKMFIKSHYIKAVH